MLEGYIVICYDWRQARTITPFLSLLLLNGNGFLCYYGNLVAKLDKNLRMYNFTRAL